MEPHARLVDLPRLTERPDGTRRLGQPAARLMTVAKNRHRRRHLCGIPRTHLVAHGIHVSCGPANGDEMAGSLNLPAVRRTENREWIQSAQCTDRILLASFIGDIARFIL